jgi:hypothetical protein
MNDSSCSIIYKGDRNRDMNGESLVGDDKTENLLVKEIPHPSSMPFPTSLLKDFVVRHVVSKETQVSQDALELLNRVFDEMGGWIVRESEKMARCGGRTRIASDHIRGAVKLYLGWEEEK